MSEVPHYADYLRLGELLSLQRPGRDLAHPDELLFIVQHQVTELWFRLVLHELCAARDILGRYGAHAGEQAVAEPDVARACEHLARVVEIERVLVEQFRVIETLPPAHFLAFRDRLTGASGFQSVQFREIEVVAGLTEQARVAPAEGFLRAFSPEERERLARRAAEPSLSDALIDWLGRTPIERAAPRFVEDYLAAFDAYVAEQERAQRQNPHLSPEDVAALAPRFAAMQKECRCFLTGFSPAVNRAHAAFLFIAVYRDEPLLAWPYALLDRVIEFEQYLRLWRYRHARMVERIIGLRVGTGGSPGVSYLDRTAFGQRIFGRLLEARGLLLDSARLPPLGDPSSFRFRFQTDS